MICVGAGVPPSCRSRRPRGALVREEGIARNPSARYNVENHALASDMAETMKDLEELRMYEQSVEDEGQQKAIRLRQRRTIGMLTIYDFAVNKVEKLQKELDRKNGKVPVEAEQCQKRDPRVAD